MNAYYEAAAQLPDALAGPLLRIAPGKAIHVTEIRIRSGRPVCLTTPQETLFVSQAQGAVEALPKDALATSHAMVQECFYAACGYSVHSFEAAIAQGYVPMQGGHRAGICGAAVLDEVFSVKNITGLNVRIARVQKGECPPVVRQLLQQRPVGLLVAGAPGSGKTTLLRAVVAHLSADGQKVAVVDERQELMPLTASGFAQTPPLHCDVLSGYPKHIGMQHALRSMGPDVLVCDEIGTMEDVQAIAGAANAGVGLVATLHAQRREMLRHRPQCRALLHTGAVTHIALLRGPGAPGQVAEVWDAADFA